MKNSTDLTEKTKHIDSQTSTTSLNDVSSAFQPEPEPWASQSIPFPSMYDWDSGSLKVEGNGNENRNGDWNKNNSKEDNCAVCDPFFFSNLSLSNSLSLNNSQQRVLKNNNFAIPQTSEVFPAAENDQNQLAIGFDSKYTANLEEKIIYDKEYGDSQSGSFPLKFDQNFKDYTDQYGTTLSNSLNKPLLKLHSKVSNPRFNPKIVPKPEPERLKPSSASVCVPILPIKYSDHLPNHLPKHSSNLSSNHSSNRFPKQYANSFSSFKPNHIHTKRRKGINPARGFSSSSSSSSSLSSPEILLKKESVQRSQKMQDLRCEDSIHNEHNKRNAQPDFNIQDIGFSSFNCKNNLNTSNRSGRNNNSTNAGSNSCTANNKRMADDVDHSNSSSSSSGQQNQQRPSAVYYCHWGNNCEQVKFYDELEFENHLKSEHLQQHEHYHNNQHQQREQQQNQTKSLVPVEESLEKNLQNVFDNGDFSGSIISNSLPFSEISKHQRQQEQQQSFLQDSTNQAQVVRDSASQDLTTQEQTNSDLINQEDSVNKYICNWDSCKFEIPELDSLLDHIKRDHWDSVQKFPHSDCCHHQHHHARNEYKSLKDVENLGTIGNVDNLENLGTPESVGNYSDDHIPINNNDGADLFTASQLSATQSPSMSPFSVLKDNNNSNESNSNSISGDSSSIQCKWQNCDFNTTDATLLDSHLLSMHMNPVNSVDHVDPVNSMDSVFIPDLLSPKSHSKGGPRPPSTTPSSNFSFYTKLRIPESRLSLSELRSYSQPPEPYPGHQDHKHSNCNHEHSHDDQHQHVNEHEHKYNNCLENTQDHQHALKNGVTMYQCEWNACNYQSPSFNDFMSHVRTDHVRKGIMSVTALKEQAQKFHDCSESICVDNDCADDDCADNVYVDEVTDHDGHSFLFTNEPVLSTDSSATAISLFSQELLESQAELSSPLEPLEPLESLKSSKLPSPLVVEKPKNGSSFSAFKNSKKETLPTSKPKPKSPSFNSSSDQTAPIIPAVKPPAARGRPNKPLDIPKHHICRWLVTDPSSPNDGTHECGHVASDPSTLSAHVIDTHVGARKHEYTCLWANCDRHTRPFTQRQKIVRHLQTHTKNRPYKCPVCGNRFAEEAVLNQHLRTHSGEKPFKCQMCDKKFAASTALSVHMRTHTGEKPLACKWPGCNKRFSESSNLAKHMKTHSAERNYACTYPGCEKRFGRNDQLQRHYKTHEKKDRKD